MNGANEESFVPKRLDYDLEWLRHYGTVQSSEKELKDEPLRQLFARAVLEEAAKIVKKDVLPTEAYAVQHIKLFPAGAFKPLPEQERRVFFHREDSARLYYSNGKRHYLLVETGSDETGRFLLFVRDEDNRKEIPLAEITEFPLKTGVTWLVLEGAACLFVNLTQFHFPDAGMSPSPTVLEPDRWFVGAKKRIQMDETIEKARQRRLEGSPEYVKELMSHLPKGDHKGEELYKHFLQYNELIAAEKDPENRGHYITGRAQVIEDLEQRVRRVELKSKPPDELKNKQPQQASQP